MFDQIKIDHYLQQNLEHGAALISQAFNQKQLQIFFEECQTLKFSRPEIVSDVRQKFTRFAFQKTDVPKNIPAITKLRQDIETWVQSSKNFAQLRDWQAYDTVIQKYSHDGELGAHLDLKRHPGVIVICSISGACVFAILHSKKGPVKFALQPQPGDILLLRAPGLSGDPNLDDRPPHWVSGNIHESDPFRISVTFRHNLKPAQPIRAFSYDHPQRSNDV